MNIIFGDNVADSAREKYTVLELDTFRISGQDQTATAYAILERIPLEEMGVLSELVDLHKSLIQEYNKRNWKYCEDAIEQLTGKWNGELDTFYSELLERLQLLKTQSLDEAWSGVIVRSTLT